jgi:hypothetical protein
MNYSSFISKFGGAVLAAVTSGFIVTSAYAQPAPSNPSDTVYFDPVPNGNGTSGGSGDFATSDFWNPSTSSDGTFVSGTNGVGTLTFGEGAVFNGPASTVTVSAPVSPDYLQVGVTSGTETFGTTGANASEITFPQGNANTPSGAENTPTIPVTQYFVNAINIEAGSANVVFNSGLNFSGFNRYYNYAQTVNSASTGNVAFNGGITFTNNVSAATADYPVSQGTGEPDLGLSGVAGTTFTINSAVTAVSSPGAVTAGNPPQVQLWTNNTLTLTSNASFSGNTSIEATSGTILDQGASYVDSPLAPGQNRQVFVGGTAQYLTDVANMTVTGGVQFVNGGGTVGSALAAETTYSGIIIGYSGTDMNLTSGTGGRVNFTGDVLNGNGLGINKVGTGTVVIHNANANGTLSNGGTQGGSWDIKNGTLLLNGTVATNTGITGSGLTIDAVAPGAINANQTYATLGGIGSTNVPIVAAGGTSIIAPGDPTVNSGVGTLGLLGGLTASSGVTLAFNISGATSSEIDFGSAALTLGGTTNVDIVAVGPVLAYNPITQTNTYYTLAVGTGTWTSTPTFNFVTPAGYVIDHVVYGPVGPGGSDVFKVELIAAPEPSTYALMGLGMLVLIATVRSRKLRA